MTLGQRTATLLFGIFAILVPAVGLAGQCPGGAIVIQDVTAYVGASLDRREHVDVVIDDGRITVVRPTSRVANRSECTSVVEGGNLFLTPGLIDLHVHVTKAGPEFLELLPTLGLTSVRDMGSSIDEINELRRRGEAGLAPIPHISSPGAMFETRKTMEKVASERTLEPWKLVRQEVAGVADLEKAMAQLKKDGANFIKIRSATDADEYRRIATAAGAAGLRVASHPPPGIPPEQLAGLKIASIEHGSYPYPIVGGDGPVDEVARSFVSQDIAIVPTIVAWKSQVASIGAVRKSANQALNDPGMLRFIPPRLAVEWSYDLSRRKPRNEDALKAWHGFYEQLIADLRALHKEGVRLGAGSDVGVEGVVPGIAALQELCALESEVGVPAAELLRANTAQAAQLAGLGNVTGRIEAGLSADLVLWSSDPGGSIARAIPSIKASYLRGVRFTPPSDLGRLVGDTCADGSASAPTRDVGAQ